MNGLEFDLALAGADMAQARESLQRFDESEFQEWAKQFDKLPEAVIRLGWPAEKKRRTKAE